eukprot:1101451-Rhodomonas_salina.1
MQHEGRERERKRTTGAKELVGKASLLNESDAKLKRKQRHRTAPKRIPLRRCGSRKCRSPGPTGARSSAGPRGSWPTAGRTRWSTPVATAPRSHTRQPHSPCA